MDIKLREDIVRFLQRIVNANPDTPTSMRHYQSDAYLLENELRQEIKPEESIIDCPNDSIAKILIRLTPTQREHYASLKWLFNEGPRGGGRTYLLALTFIEASLNNKKWVKLRDHSEYNDGINNVILESARKIIANSPELSMMVKKVGNSLKIKVKQVTTIRKVYTGGKVLEIKK